MTDIRQTARQSEHHSKLTIEQLSLHYGHQPALDNITMAIPAMQVCAMIGPSGCGKSTLLRVLNRMNDLIPGTRISGQVRLDGQPVYDSAMDIQQLRMRVGMVFQKPNPFPMSIHDNISYGLRAQGINDRQYLNETVEKALKSAALWNEVKDRLKASALSLSGGQQQRLCIARTLAMAPEVILMDEPTSALDPVATARIEELVGQLSRDFTIVMVTHSMNQARRVANRVAFFLSGRLVEYNDSSSLFSQPKDKRTRDYINGRFG